MTTSTSTESLAAMQILGTDSWARFDVWAERAWDCAEKAAAVAANTDSLVSSNDDLDHRVVALFHAMNLAKDIATMVNPLSAVSGAAIAKGGVAGAPDPEVSVLVITKEDDD